MTKILKVKGLSGSDIEWISKRDLAIFEPACLEAPRPFCVWRAYDMLDHFGIETMVVEDIGAEGMCFVNKGVVTIALDNETYEGCCDDNPRDRFTVSHEICHALYHGQYLFEECSFSSALFRCGEVKPYEDPEWQANRYASALLMPAKMVCEVLDNPDSMFAPDVLMETFEVSYTAATKRIQNLKKMRIL